MTDIRSWLESRGLGKYADEFAAQDITPDLLPELSDADLHELGEASLGDRKRLLKAVATPAAAERAVPRAGSRPLVGRTALRTDLQTLWHQGVDAGTDIHVADLARALQRLGVAEPV